jgi:hypothetical protein
MHSSARASRSIFDLPASDRGPAISALQIETVRAATGVGRRQPWGYGLYWHEDSALSKCSITGLHIGETSVSELLQFVIS